MVLRSQSTLQQGAMTLRSHQPWTSVSSPVSQLVNVKSCELAQVPKSDKPLRCMLLAYMRLRFCRCQQKSRTSLSNPVSQARCPPETTTNAHCRLTCFHPLAGPSSSFGRSRQALWARPSAQLRLQPVHTVDLLTSTVLQVPAAILDVNVKPCEVGQVPNQEHTQCMVCPASSYSFDPLVDSCKPCPQGADCNGGASLLPQQQFWHSAPDSDHIVSCPNSNACAGNSAALLACQNATYASLAGVSAVRCILCHSTIYLPTH